MSLDRWISITIEGTPSADRVAALHDHEDVDACLRRDLHGGDTLLMVRVRPGGDFESLLFGLAFADDASSSIGPGADHEEDPAARAWEALARVHSLSRAMAHAVDDLAEEMGSPCDAIGKIREDITRLSYHADWTARAILEAYRGLLEEVLTTWTSGSAARNLITRRLVASGRRLSAEGLRVVARLISMWALSVLSMGGAEKHHPLMLGPSALACMLVSVQAVEHQTDQLVQRLG